MNPHPTTLHLTECNCPAGRWQASIPRANITTWHNDPAEAATQAIRAWQTQNEGDVLGKQTSDATA